MPGSGLGLSIVPAGRERHAGSTEAGTSPAGGARLVFRLPGQPWPPRADAEAPVPADPAPPASARVSP